MKKNTKKINEGFELMLNEGYIPKIFKKGDVVDAKVIESNEDRMIVDVGARTEGIIMGRELKLDNEKVIKKTGETIIVFVVSPENKQGQIELSIRQTGDELKWHDLADAKETNRTIKVKVIEANTGGVLVEIGGGLRGFVPRSQLANERVFTNVEYSDKDEAAKQVQSKLAQLIDEELSVKVMEINRDQNKIILSEKHAGDSVDMKKRSDTLLNLKVGDMLEGAVTAVAPFGLFVNAEGLEGLVHLSEISWDKVSNPGDIYKVGTTIKVQVIGLNDNGKRVAFSIKRLQKDPWRDTVKKYKVGQVVNGTISNIADYGAFVKIEEGLNGLIHISELSHKLVKNPSDIVKQGQEVEVMIISISNDDRHLGLSLKRMQKKESKKDSTGEADGSEELTAEKKFSDGEGGREMDSLSKIIGE
jgi:small subunit ribosomal protein S1